MQQLDPKAKWLFFLNGLVWNAVLIFFLLSFIVPFFFSLVASKNNTLDGGFYSGFITPIVLFFIFDIAFSYLWAHFSWLYYKYELSENGFKKESGVISKKYVTIPYDRIQNVDIYRGPFARILGLSDLHIQTAGMSVVTKGGATSEGRLPGITFENAEKLRDELIDRATHARGKAL